MWGGPCTFLSCRRGPQSHEGAGVSQVPLSQGCSIHAEQLHPAPGLHRAAQNGPESRHTSASHCLKCLPLKSSKALGQTTHSHSSNSRGLRESPPARFSRWHAPSQHLRVLVVCLLGTEKHRMQPAWKFTLLGATHTTTSLSARAGRRRALGEAPADARVPGKPPSERGPEEEPPAQLLPSRPPHHCGRCPA